MKREKLTTQLLDLILNSEVPLRLLDISKSLGIKSDTEEYAILQSSLEHLIGTGVIEKTAKRRYVFKQNDSDSTITGTIRIENDKGVIETQLSFAPKVSIQTRNLNTALHGDTVVVQLHAQKKGKKPRGEVTKIIERNKTAIVGTIDYNGYYYFLIPDEAHYYVDFLIPETKLKGAQKGDKVKTSLLHWDDPLQSPTAEVKEIIGKSGVPVVEFDSIIREFELPTEFPDGVMKELAAVVPDIKRKPPGRMDLRNKLIITIDPFDAKDFDDALSLDMLPNGNYKLGVHIADVSHYVPENSETDIEARYRGNSVYLVDRVVPMLPELLSNEICSLNPNVPRLTFSVFMEIDMKGNVVDYEIAESIIKSKRRYNYDEVLEIIESKSGDNSQLILQLHDLAERLKYNRFRNGGINFDTTEFKFILDENKQPIEVLLKRTTKATSLVEECMLLANQTVTLHIKKLRKEYFMELPFLYRVHEEPDPKRISEVLEFIASLGHKTKKKKITSSDINNILESFDGKPEERVVNQVLIRSMAKAIYTDKNVGHYGLGFTDYSHFTSPIRRYPDLIVHRLLKEYAKGKPSPDRLVFLKMFVKDCGFHTSSTERTAMEAERASIKLTHAVMSEKHIGSSFNGTITGVTGFGLFVQMDDIWAEGLLHIRDINDDYYVFEEAKYRLVGKRSKKIFGLGMRVRVKIIKVNINKRNIDLAYVDSIE